MLLANYYINRGVTLFKQIPADIKQMYNIKSFKKFKLVIYHNLTNVLLL